MNKNTWYFDQRLGLFIKLFANGLKRAVFYWGAEEFNINEIYEKVNSQVHILCRT